MSVKILHISDLHLDSSFFERTAISAEKRLLELAISVKEQAGGEIDFLVISGDLGAKGESFDYVEVTRVIDKLIGEEFLNLKPERVIICAGNHDLDRGKLESFLEKSENFEFSKRRSFLEKKFQEFQKHFDALSSAIQMKHYGGTSKSPLHRISLFPDQKLRFIILNSAYYSLGNSWSKINSEITSDLGILSLGGVEVKKLLNSIPSLEEEQEFINIAVIHHGKNWLSWDSNYDSHTLGNAEYAWVTEKSHIILSGHEHGTISEPDYVHNRSQLFVCGAAHLNITGSYHYGASLLEVSNKKKSVKRFPFYHNSQEGWSCLTKRCSSYPLFEPDSQLLLDAKPKPELRSFLTEEPTNNSQQVISSKLSSLSREQLSDKIKKLTFDKLQTDYKIRQYQTKVLRDEGGNEILKSNYSRDQKVIFCVEEFCPGISLDNIDGIQSCCDMVLEKMERASQSVEMNEGTNSIYWIFYALDKRGKDDRNFPLNKTFKEFFDNRVKKTEGVRNGTTIVFNKLKLFKTQDINQLVNV